MRLTRLTLEHFRLVREARLELAPGANLFLGENAQGKTTLLEAVAYLANGRSFRTARDRDCVAWETREAPEQERFAAVEGEFETRGVAHTLRTAMTDTGKSFWLDGKQLRRLGDLWGLLNAVVFIPGDVALVQGAPGERRSFLDSLLARTSRPDLLAMQSYAAALRQRNALLRSEGSARELEAYEAPMAEHGARLLVGRRNLLAELNMAASEQFRLLTGGVEHFTLAPESGFPRAAGVDAVLANGEGGPTPGEVAGLAEKLRNWWFGHRGHDRERGHTQHGPHRGDVSIKLDGADARAYASQGQARSIVLALRLAEAELSERLCGEAPILLLDDVMGELDRHRTRHFIELLSRGHLQSLITATDAAALEEALPIERRFRVVRGVVTPE